MINLLIQAPMFIKNQTVYRQEKSIVFLILHVVRLGEQFLFAGIPNLMFSLSEGLC